MCRFAFKDKRSLSIYIPENVRPERRFQRRPLRCQCSAPPVDQSGQLGVGRYVGR